MHSLILSGTPTGAAAARSITLDLISNVQTFDNLRLDYIVALALNLTTVANSVTFYTVDLENVVVTELDQTTVTNTNTFDAIDLQAIPFTADNTETTTLLTYTTGDYTTTIKRQIDTFIGEMKTAGVWSELDWFYGGRFMANEADSLLDWTDPTRSLVKVGSPTFTPFVGWQGATPAIADARLKSGWNIGDGPNSTSTSFTAFAKIESLGAENGLQPFGVWRRITGGGPSTPDGIFLSLSIVANSGFAGANVNSGEGNTAFTPGDGLGVWAIVRNGATTKTFKDGTQLESDAVSTTSGYTHADGMSILGSAGLAKRSFNGVQSFAGWGAALTSTQLTALVAAYTTALDPPVLISDALIVDGSDNYLLVDADNYLKVL